MNIEKNEALPVVDELDFLVASLELGHPQVHGSLTVIPLQAHTGEGPAYLSLAEALDKGQVVIGEISQQGSVPELQAENLGDTPVLLLDGEEVRGAKQNRVLNTSVLLKERSCSLIPVSCTESGRWRYKSPVFADSGLVMAQKSRANKVSSVSDSLHAGHQYHSDQAKVWADVASLHEKGQTSSPTQAMSDAFAAQERELERYRHAFSLVPQQHGLMVLFHGQVAGFDYVSRPDVYAQLHSKLLKSYLIEALLAVDGRESPAPEVALDRARRFLSRAANTDRQRYPSISCGVSLRFKARDLAGAALVHDGRVIHVAALNPYADFKNHQEQP